MDAPSRLFRTPVVLLAALCACVPDDLATLDGDARLGPVPVGDALAVGDPEAERLVLLDLDAGRVTRSRHLALSGRPTLVTALPTEGGASQTVLALCPEAHALDLIDVKSAARETLDLGAPFPALALAPDGTRGLAYYPPGSTSTVFHNPNELAHLDLTATAETRVVRRTLASLGGAPTAIAISPRIGDRRYALVLSDAHVAVLNLDAPARAERSVPLVSLSAGGDRTPTAVTFGLADDTLWALVATAEASSIYALAITATDATTSTAADFAVRLSQLPGFGPRGAATLVTLGTDAPALHALTTHPTAGTVSLTNVATATGLTLSVEAGLDALLPFDASGTPMALAWRKGASRFLLIDLEALRRGESRAITTRTTRTPFSRLLPLPGGTRFLAVHDASSGDGVSIIDAETDRITGFGRTGNVTDISMIENLDSLHILSQVDGNTFLVTVDLASLHPEVTAVPGGGERLAVLPGADTLAAIAYRQGGLVTLWPLDDTSAEAALSVPGFLLEGLFDGR